MYKYAPFLRIIKLLQTHTCCTDSAQKHFSDSGRFCSIFWRPFPESPESLCAWLLWCSASTGLCSYRVRAVDDSCVKHLTVESYTVVMLLTFILIIISIPSSPLFHSRLKTFLSANPSHRSLPFLLQDWLHRFPGLFSDTSEHACFYYSVFSSVFFHF